MAKLIISGNHATIHQEDGQPFCQFDLNDRAVLNETLEILLTTKQYESFRALIVAAVQAK